MKVNLYTTCGCHLCEEAFSLLQLLQHDGWNLQINEVEIATSDSLIERYGVRIPVIATDAGSHGSELGWPFSQKELTEFLIQAGTAMDNKP